VTRPSRGHVASRLLSFVLPGEEVDTVIGDLEEEYVSRPSHARGRWYWAQVVRSVPFLLWIPIQRGGLLPTLGIAFAACAAQATLELAAGFAVYSWFPPDAPWPRLMTLTVTLPSLLFVSYRAARACPGAATVVAGVAVLTLLGQLLLASQSGHGMPDGLLAALVIVPSLALTGGSLALARRG
jgi:hypothetical protein